MEQPLDSDFFEEKKLRKFYYAGVLDRTFAFIVDLIIMSVVEYFTPISLSLPIYILYFSLFESSQYQGTLGKMLIGIIVVDMDGNRLSFLRALGRSFSKVICYMTLWIGFLIAFFTDQKQGLHDLIAKTLVIEQYESY